MPFFPTLQKKTPIIEEEKEETAEDNAVYVEISNIGQPLLEVL